MGEKLKEVCSLNGHVRQRFVLVFMMLMGILNTYTMRVSLNIALVKMSVGTNATKTAGGEFVSGMTPWNRPIQGYIKGAFYYGYVATHIPGGMLADRYGGKWVLFAGIASTTIFTILIPVVSRNFDYPGLIALRVLTGLGEGVVFPSIGVLLAKWSPATERSRLGSVTLSGAQLGIVITSALTGLTLSAWVWDYTFYFYGAIGVLFCLFWSLMVFSVPQSNPYITDRELEYLENTVAPKKIVDPIPWKKILLSVQVWGLVIGQFGHDWGLFTMIHELPQYLNDILKYDIRANGLLSAVPYLLMWICSIVLGMLADYLISRGKLTVLKVRIIWTIVASVIPALGMMAITFPEDRRWAIAFASIGMMGMGGYYSGMRVNALDISKNYAGTVMAFHNGLGAFSGIISPNLIGNITKDSTRAEWRLAYMISAGILLVSCVLYCLSTKDQRQYWDYQSDEQKPEKPNFEWPWSKKPQQAAGGEAAAKAASAPKAEAAAK